MVRLPQEKIDRIQEGYAEGISIKNIAEKENVSYSAVYNHTRLPERGFTSKEYNQYLAKQKGFASERKYDNYLAKQRQKRPKNRELSDMLNNALEEKDKNKSWLARKIDVTPQAISLYTTGKVLPTKEVFKRICSVFDWSYETLDDLVA